MRSHFFSKISLPLMKHANPLVSPTPGLLYIHYGSTFLISPGSIVSYINLCFINILHCALNLCDLLVPSFDWIYHFDGLQTLLHHHHFTFPFDANPSRQIIDYGLPSTIRLTPLHIRPLSMWTLRPLSTLNQGTGFCYFNSVCYNCYNRIKIKNPIWFELNRNRIANLTPHRFPFNDS